MIVGLGLDLIETTRIAASLQRFGLHFVHKLLHPEEIPGGFVLDADASPRTIQHIASRFAAKEAAVKALGTGFSLGICLHDVRVFSRPSGQPFLSFHGKAFEQFTALGASHAHLTLTHSASCAAAVVVLEG